MASSEMSVGDRKIEDGKSEIILERLRNKASHMKPWTETIKAYRLALLDKRYTVDNADRLQMQKCLDTLQKSIKVTSLQAMVERLESITRQLRKRNFDDCSLKFTAGPNGTDCFISSDMFYVEVLLEMNGSVKDVKIAHHGDPVSCSELTQVLRAGDFTEFTSHLEGLTSIYQLNADKKQKSKAYLALQALETDLSMLAQLQSSINEPSNLVHKSPVGILQLRKGGHPMKLTYFISPYDLLDMETKSSIPLTVDTVVERQLGQYVTVCIESSTSHKLQTQSLMSITRTNDGKSLPSFAAPSNLNSTTLPANFVLKLASPMPIATALVKKIQAVTCIECADMSSSQPLLSLITQLASKGEMDCNNNKGLFVVLPDQHHCYFLNGAADLQGAMVSSIPFTHPTHVPQILVFLRQQMLFNVLISSCIRTGSKQDLETALMFEVTALSWLHVSVSFEHPLEESMATAEFDLSDITNVKCKLCTMGSDASICSDEYASKVVQRCLSIPVTMRAVIRKAQGQQKKANQSNEDIYVTMVTGNSGKFLSNAQNSTHNEGSNNQGGNNNAKFVSDFDVKLCRSGNRTSDSQSISKLDVLNTNVGSSSSSSYNMPSPDIATTPLGMDGQGYNESSPAHGDLFPLNSERASALILSGNHFGPPNSSQPSNLGKSGNSVTVTNTNQRQLVTLVSNAMGGHVKPRKERVKRKAVSEGNSPRSQTGRSPKQKHSEDDLVKDLSQSDVEVGNSSSMTTIPLGVDMELSVRQNIDPGLVKSTLEGMVKYEPMGSRAEINQHLMHRGSTSMHNESNAMDSDFFNSGNQNRSNEAEFNYKSEPMDFENEVYSNQNSTYDDGLMESGDEFNLEQLGINSSVLAAKIEKNKEAKKLKKLKLEIATKLGDKEQSGDGDAKSTPPPVIFDIISSQLKVVEPTKNACAVDLTEKRPNVEIIPIGNTSGSSSASLLTQGGLKIGLKSGESKLKQRDFRRGLVGDRSDKKSKGEGKRERKRKHLESLNSSDDKSGNKLLAVSITPVPLMTGSGVNVDKGMSIVSKSNEPTLPKSITLSVKSISASSSMSTSTAAITSKTVTTSCKKPQLPLSTTVSPTKSVSILKTPQSNKAKQGSIKPLGMVKSGQLGDSKTLSPSANKVTISPLKVHSGKAKSSSSKSLVSGSKPTTVRLKHLNIPSSTTVTPIIKASPTSTATTTLPSPTVTSPPVTFTALTAAASGVSTPTTPTSTAAMKMPALSVTTSVGFTNPTVTSTSATDSSSNGSGNATSGESGGGGNATKLSKSANRSRKGSLSAVIDKLRNSNRQSGSCDGQPAPSERKESKDGGGGSGGGGGEKKEAMKKESSHKDVGGAAKTGDKPKVGSGAEQKLSEKKPEFTVKQSSQGIKLTVTKTRSTESGGSKLSSSLKNSSSKLNASSNKSGTATTGGSSGGSVPKMTPSGGATGSKPGVGPASSKKLSGVSTSSKSPGGAVSAASGSSNSAVKPTVSKTPPLTSAGATFVSSATTKPISSATVKQSGGQKHGSADGKSVTSLSGTKMSERVQKSLSSTGHENSKAGGVLKLEKSSSLPNSMPPPPPPPIATDMGGQSRKSDDANRQRQSPKQSGSDETEAERQFRLLLAQTKMESNSGSTTTLTNSNLITKPTVTNSQPPLSSASGICSTAEKPEGSRTPKQELSDRSPKNNDGRSTPKTSTSGEKLFNFITNITNITSSMSSKTTPVVTMTTAVSEAKTMAAPVKASESGALKSTEVVNKCPGPASPPESASKVPNIFDHLKAVVKRQQNSPSNDDVSSPEDSLIIDYPGTPHHKSPEKKLKNVNVEQVVATGQTKSPTSPMVTTARSPAQPSPGIKSPMVIGTPHSDHSNPSSVARSSPCVIDDDLMDEALMGVGK
uniref:Mediator of RNA polymerase II transcription subunit 1 n=1 Tax=Strigamia maritima TaxID=126957 RepID=T1J8I3_STRMM